MRCPNTTLWIIETGEWDNNSGAQLWLSHTLNCELMRDLSLHKNTWLAPSLLLSIAFLLQKIKWFSACSSVTARHHRSVDTFTKSFSAVLFCKNCLNILFPEKFSNLYKYWEHRQFFTSPCFEDILNFPKFFIYFRHTSATLDSPERNEDDIV